MKRLLFRLLPSLLLLTALAARAQDTIGWHVVRPGETLEAITARYLGSSAAWRENWRLNPALANPHQLTPGQRIRVILARSLPARFARVDDLSRKVHRKPEPSPWTPAQRGDVLAQRHGVQTFEASSASLHFDDQTRLTLTENSLVFLREMRAVEPQRDRSDIEIVMGTADVERPAKTARPSNVQVTVGTTKTEPRAGARGTSARIRGDDNVARVMAYRGGASVTSAGSAVDVAQGMGVVVPPGQRPPAPERLLPAPSISGVEAHTARPELRWPAVAGAASYTVEVCADPQCHRLIERGATAGQRAWAPRQPLHDGDSFWRVTARSTSGLDGYPSGSAKLVVRLRIGGTIEVDGRPAPGVAVSAYRDDGDNVPDEGDIHAGNATSTDSGRFAFTAAEDALHWIVVDSRSFAGGGWPEQTSGPSGSICAERVIAAAGPCDGGRTPASDAPGSPGTAEHIAGLRPGTEDARFGFSHEVVTTTRDATPAQGSLRQFLANAASVPLVRTMRFAPMETSPSGWWSIVLTAPLPALSRDGVVLDGGAPISGIVGTRAVTAHQTPLRNPDRPRLVLDLAGTGPLQVEAATTIRNLAIVNGTTHIVAAADLLVENAVIGLRPDGAIPPAGIQRNGIELRSGSTTLRRVLFSQLPGTAIDAAASASLVAEHVEVLNCAFRGDTSAVVLRGRGSRIRNCHFSGNAAEGRAAVEDMTGENEIAESRFRANREAIRTPRADAAAANVIE